MKRKLFIPLFLLILLLVNPIVFAKEVTTCERLEDNNYQVHKKWKITNGNISNVKQTPCVDAKEKIYDFEGVLSDSDYEQLQNKINAFIKKTDMDLVIVIADIPYYSDSTNEEYAADFYDYNDFGIDFDRYSGVLFLRNTYDQDPYYNIYTFGDAQLYFDYNRLENILDNVYDDIHSEYYYSGFSSFIDQLENYYDRGKALNNYTVDENGYLQEIYVFPFGWVFALSLGLTIIIMVVLVKKNKMIAKAYEAGEYADENSIQINNRIDQFLTTHTTSYTVSSSSGGSGGGGGHHSSGGSSGGGHSSGGGRHG